MLNEERDISNKRFVEFSPEVCLAVVQQNSYAIMFFANVQRTLGVCLAAVQGDGMVIEFLTDAQRTPEVCLAAVRNRGLALRLLKEEQCTPEVCMEAVKNDPKVIRYVPNSVRVPGFIVSPRAVIPPPLGGRARWRSWM